MLKQVADLPHALYVLRTSHYSKTWNL